MPRERQQSVKSDSMVNGDGRSSNNGGPGSVPTLTPHGGAGGGGPPSGRTSNFMPNQGQNEADIAELFSPVSESSNVAQGLFDDTGAPRIPMSPYSAAGGGGGGMMSGSGPPQQQQGGQRLPHSQGPPGVGGIPYGMPPHQQPPYLRPQQHHLTSIPPGGGGGGHPHHHMMPGHHGGGKIYPPNQPMVFNPANPNAPPIYPCGVCHKEIHDSDQAILCESGCNFWFHRTCTGLSDLAYLMLTKEVYAEWVCERCLASGSIPLVKMKS